jgi:hypothetical protein
MYQKLNQNRGVKVILSVFGLAMLLSLVSLFPYEEVEAQNALGTFFGGRITSSFPTGFAWYNGVTPMYCPPHIWIVSFGAPYKGPLPLLMPPAMPKAQYNWYLPGVAVKGAYYPAPIPPWTLCPYPVFITSLMGTSLTP